LQQLRKVYDIHTTTKQNIHRTNATNAKSQAILYRTGGKGEPTSPRRRDPPAARKEMTSASPTSAKGMSSYSFKSELKFNDIVGSINGFARIVKYRSCPSPGQFVNPQFMKRWELEVLSVEEGLFRNGKKAGYCRVLDGQTGHVQCGFFKNNLPSGKYVKFDSAGIQIEGGIMKGQQCVSNLAITSFVYNVETSY